MKHAVLPAVLTGVAVVGLILVVQKDEHSTAVVASGTAPKTAPSVALLQPTMDDPNEALEWLPMSINRLVSQSELGVVATVTDVSAPKWNSPDGAPWAARMDESAAPVAFKYRDVRVQVDRVLFESTKRSAKLGDSFTVYVPGDGTHTGAKVATPAGTRPFNDANGDFMPGSHVVLLLSTEQLSLSDGTTVPRLALTASYQANWRIDEKNNAVSADPQRTVPVDALINRIASERARGAQAVESPAERDKTTRNPLGDSQGQTSSPGQGPSSYPSEQRPAPQGDPVPPAS
ncbi:MAG TPA: hypothetical protein VG034_08255 [Acidimicrobiia bacterium]|jgi:hypothetical protein|nr:hypothetical protein [Acidimicrobiia bacterium]